ncbi:MAG: hypothetical protein MJ237_06220 [bacterium]|nr:hypothetical protein [bacterium]
MIQEYKLDKIPFCDIQTRELCVPYSPLFSQKVDEHFISNDVITEIIIDNKLFALQYERRDYFNKTEVTQIVLGTKEDIDNIMIKSDNKDEAKHNQLTELIENEKRNI